MLRKLIPVLAKVIIATTLVLGGSVLVCSESSADGCTSAATPSDRFGSGSVTVSVSCENQVDGVARADTPSGGAAGESSEPACYYFSVKIHCTDGEYQWIPERLQYCKSYDAPADSPDWGMHRDEQGNPVGMLMICHFVVNRADGYGDHVAWMDTPDAQPGVDPAALVRTAVTSLGLHAPKVGIGAYVYPGYEDWGLSWWVGAPMWLWVNSADDLQWGTHTISAAQDGVSVTATVTSTKTVFDPGDGSRPVLCRVPGTPRPWSGDDLMRNHSPSGCEFTYLETNTMGDRNSRFTVSATTTWLVAWSASDGRSGTFTIDMPSTENPSIHVGEIYTVLVPPPTPK